MSDERTLFCEQVTTLMSHVFALVKACPAGHVTTYSAISKALGYPRGARMIGWIMNESAQDVPAQRVVSSKGELTGSWAFGQRGKMRQLLEAEGIIFSPDEHVDLKRYAWDPSNDLSEEERTHILANAEDGSITPSSRLLHLLQNDPASPLRDNR
jgi:methylated-DNA-protein-cysteine methyltransferase-like protein